MIKLLPRWLPLARKSLRLFQLIGGHFRSNAVTTFDRVFPKLFIRMSDGGKI